jgi:ribonucleotide reductase beta subunit family protein with ferritin-like domain
VQLAKENIHDEMYKKALNHYANKQEREDMDVCSNLDTEYSKQREYQDRSHYDTKSFAERMIISATMNCIKNSSVTCCVKWLKRCGLASELNKMFEYIDRDRRYS